MILALIFHEKHFENSNFGVSTTCLDVFSEVSFSTFVCANSIKLTYFDDKKKTYKISNRLTPMKVFNVCGDMCFQLRQTL